MLVGSVPSVILERDIISTHVGGKEVMVTRGSGAKQNAEERTLLDVNFDEKKITEESEDIHRSDKQGRC